MNMTAFTGHVNPLFLKSGFHALTIQPECTKKSKSFTHFEESIYFRSVSRANYLSRGEIDSQDSTYLTELPDRLSLQRTSILHGFSQHRFFND